tara:strand:- start:60 stop:347 length:288 start_codon:yes stop_codon:yes gene_type:complete
MLLFFCRVADPPMFLFVVRKYNNTPLWVACCYLYCLYCIGGWWGFRQDNIAEEHTAERERITWKQQWLHWGWEQQHINGKKSSTLYIVLIYAANQ